MFVFPEGRPCFDEYLSWDYLSVQFSCSVVSDSLDPMNRSMPGLPPCPSPTPGVYPNLCPSSQWCHPTISTSVVPFPPALNLSQHQSLFKFVRVKQDSFLTLSKQHWKYCIKPRSAITFFTLFSHFSHSFSNHTTFWLWCTIQNLSLVPYS